MISTHEAAALIRRHLSMQPSHKQPIEQVAGAILRQPLKAERDQPPFDRVSMDGIAIRFADLAAGTRRFAVSGMQAAGMAPGGMDHADSCMEVMTGAVLPRGCDTVIPVEQTSREGPTITVAPGYQPQAGQFIHRRGSDCRAGATLVDPGVILRAPELAILAANGYAHVEVARKPRLAILATGDELVEVDGPVQPWQIRRSNDRALAAMFAAHRLDDVQLHHVSDERLALLATIDGLLQSRDVLILSGGVSMGQRDYVPGVLEELGVERVFHRIAQRPGKPMWFGIGPRRQAVFALPGNPVSALVCGARYVLPALRESMGLKQPQVRRIALTTALDFAPEMTWFVPVKLQPDETGRLVAVPMPPPTSGDFSALTHTHGFVELPAGEQHFPAGFIADYYSW